MTQITVRTLNREQFVQWMSSALSGAPAQPYWAMPSGGKDSEVTLAWPEGSTDARPVVCIARGKFQDFFAFVSTYLGNVQPYTAYFRVLPLELLQDLGRERVASLKSLDIAKMTAGASIAEASAAAVQIGDRSNNLLPLVRSTLSSVLGQCVLSGYDSRAFDWVLNEWLDIRTIRKDSAIGFDIEASSNAWRHIHAAVSSNGAGRLKSGIVDFISIALEFGTINRETLRHAAKVTNPNIDLSAMLVASREERVGWFNKLLSELRNRSRLRVEDEFLAGLMLAIVGNGSFEMLRSAREFGGWLDGAATWFGVCASLFEESNVLAYGNSVGRRTVRDVLRRPDMFGLVSADIASTELRFILSNKVDLSSFTVGGSGLIDIEILPNVVTRLPLQETGQDRQRAEDYEAISAALDEISFLADRARKRSRRATRDESPTSETKSRSRRPHGYT